MSALDELKNIHDFENNELLDCIEGSFKSGFTVNAEKGARQFLNLIADLARLQKAVDEADRMLTIYANRHGVTVSLENWRTEYGKGKDE